MKVFRFLLLAFFFHLIFSSFNFLFAERKGFDHSVWDQFLKKYVSETGEVNFKEAKSDPSLLEAYEKQLAVPVAEGRAFPREELIAVYLNAYHAGVMRAILDHYPIQNIQQVPGLWENHFIGIWKQYLSLDEIRGDIVATVRDEKIHLALWTGAKSSPRLRREAYAGPEVEGQLFLATREFVNSPKYVEIEPGKNRVVLSRLFKWYGESFQFDFATPETQREFTRTEFAVMSFLAHYLEDSEKITFLEEGRYKIKYKDFDWSLNEWVQDRKTNSESPASN